MRPLREPHDLLSKRRRTAARAAVSEIVAMALDLRQNCAEAIRHRSLSGPGSNKEVLIGAPGFEPGTSPTRTVRATRLRHAPRRSRVSGEFRG
jgi:hypothetical protein